MAQKSGDILKQMQALQSQYEQYAPASAGDIYKGLSGRVDNFRPQYQELAGLESAAYAAPATQLAKYREQYAGQPGPSAMSRLGGALGEVGRQYGSADVMRGVIGEQRGRLENIAQDVLGQYKSAQQGLLGRYQMLSPQYQSMVGMEEAARNRAQQVREAELARAAQAQQTLLARQQQDAEALRQRDWQSQQNELQRQASARSAAASRPSFDYNALLKMINERYGAVPTITQRPDQNMYSERRTGNIGLEEAQRRQAYMQQLQSMYGR